MSEAMTREQVEKMVRRLCDFHCSPSEYDTLSKSLLAQDSALRQEIERLTAERDEARKQSEDSSLIMALGANQTEHYARQSMLAQDAMRKLTAERDEWKRATSGAQDELYKSHQRLAQAEQQRDRLRAALEHIENNAQGDANKMVCLVRLEYCRKQAQQALRGEDSEHPVKLELD